jgi:hypothetical protein
MLRAYGKGEGKGYGDTATQQKKIAFKWMKAFLKLFFLISTTFIFL